MLINIQLIYIFILILFIIYYLYIAKYFSENICDIVNKTSEKLTFSFEPTVVLNNSLSDESNYIHKYIIFNFQFLIFIF